MQTRHIIGRLVIVPMLVITGISLQAQVTPIPQGAPSVSSLLHPNQTPADTGRVAWGRLDYTRYLAPNTCDRAITHMQLEGQRTRVSDTLSYSIEADTLSTAAKTIARQCGTRFTVEQTSLDQLASLLRVTLALNADDKIRAIVTRQLTLSRTLVDSAERLYDAVAILMQASPPRLVEAQSWLRTLDALGPPVRVWQYAARLELLTYWKTVWVRDQLQAVAKESITLLQTMSSDQRDAIGDVFQPYDALLDLANETQDLATQDQLMTQALTDIGSWHEGHSSRWLATRTRLLDARKSLYGKKTRPLEGQYWFNTGGTPRPVPGVVSILVRTDHTFTEKYLPLYVLLRQLHARYGDSVQITLITETRGFVPGTGILTPREEAVKASEYYLRFLKLPVGVLVDEVPFTKRSDGRIQWLTSPIGELFSQWEDVNAILVDSSSTLQWLGEVASDRDKRFLFAAIDRVLASQRKTVASTP